MKNHSNNARPSCKYWNPAVFGQSSLVTHAQRWLRIPFLDIAQGDTNRGVATIGTKSCAKKFSCAVSMPYHQTMVLWGRRGVMKKTVKSSRICFKMPSHVWKSYLLDYISHWWDGRKLLAQLFVPLIVMPLEQSDGFRCTDTNTLQYVLRTGL